MKQHLLLFSCLFFLCFMTYAQKLVPVADKKTKLYGYKEEGQIDWSLEPKFVEAKLFYNNVALVKGEKYYYFINLNGKRVSPYFKKIVNNSFDNSLPYLCKNLNDGYQIYNAVFQCMDSTIYQDLYYLPDNKAIVYKLNYKYGLMDLNGNVLIPNIYKSISCTDYFVDYKTNLQSGISDNEINASVLEVRNFKNKYGVVGYNGKILIPLRYDGNIKYSVVNKNFSSKLKPYILSDVKKSLDTTLTTSFVTITSKNAELFKTYPSDLPKIKKTVLKEVDGGYAFFRNEGRISDIYETIEPYDNYIIVEKDGKLGVVDYVGSEYIHCEFENIKRWGDNAQNDVFLLCDNEGSKLMDLNENRNLTPNHKYHVFANGIGFGGIENQWWLINEEGKIISDYAYTYVDNMRNDGKIIVEYKGYKTEISVDGKEMSPISGQIFNDAYNITDNTSKKIEKYNQCIYTDSKNKYGYAGMANNNIGVLYENLNDDNSAIKYYSEAKRMGNKIGKENLDNIYARLEQEREVMRQQRIQATLDLMSAISGTLNFAAQAMTTFSGSQNYSTTSGNSSYSKSSSNSSSSKSNYSGSVSEVQNKNTDQRTYSDYESQLIKMNTYWEREYNDSNRRYIQQQMRQIRTKWINRGYSMYHSSWEDWDGKKK